MNISLLYNIFLGETSPLIAARIDSPVNAMGARRMENMIPMMSGGLRKRPGTLFIGNTENNKAARLIEWLLSDGTCVMLEFTEGTIRVWRGNAVIQTLSSPYTAEQVKKLHYAASADELWIVHREQRPIKLVFNGIGIDMDYPNFANGDGEKDFILENNRPSCVAFDSGRLCLGGSNNEPNRIYMSRAPDSKTGEARYTDFTAEEKYIISQNIEKAAIDENGNEMTEPVTDDHLNPMYQKGNLAYKLVQTSQGPQSSASYRMTRYEKSGLTFYDVYTLTIIGNPEYEEYVGKTSMTISLNNITVGSLICDYKYNGTVNVMFVEEYHDYQNSTVASTLAGLSPFMQSLSDPGEWHEAKPLTKPVYETVTETTENIVITPSHAIVLEENDMHGSRLQWIAGNRHLLAATERATWNDTGEVPTPATFDMNIIEYAGSNNLQGRGTKEIVVYVGRDGRSLRALVWNQNAQGSGYIDMDIGERAAHLLGAGIKDFAVADYPYPMIWIATNAGELISCTVDIRQGVLAYAKHPTEGNVESVAVSHETTGDVVYLVVKRGDHRNIECLTLEDLVNADYSESHYVDAGERREYQTPTKTIDGLQRFAGKTIHIFADGAIEPPAEVNNAGIAELQTAVSKVHFGLPYKVSFSPNERPLPANGTSMGKKQRIEKITLRLYKSLGGKAGVTEEKATPIITKRFGDYKLGEAPEPFTGEYDITVSGNIDTEGKLVITHDEPAPFTLLALVERVAVLEV